VFALFFRPFNKLLITLATVDSVLILMFIQDKTLVDVFLMSGGRPEPLWYSVTFPYLLHPVRSICVTFTIFMVVAISAERYRAICHPMSLR